MLNMDSPMLCQRYTCVNESQQKEMWNSKNWIIEQKEDGCFSYDTEVLLSNGTVLPIGKIVDERLPVEVVSLNTETGRLELKKVVNWFDNGIKNNFISLTTNNHKEGYTRVTSNHKFWNGLS